MANHPKTAARYITSRPIPDVVITWHQLDAELFCRISSVRYSTIKIDPQTWSAESFPNLFDVTHEDAVRVVRRGKLPVSCLVLSLPDSAALRRSLASGELRRTPPLSSPPTQHPKGLRRLT